MYNTTSALSSTPLQEVQVITQLQISSSLHIHSQKQFLTSLQPQTPLQTITPLHYWLSRSMEFEKYKKWTKVDTCFSFNKGIGDAGSTADFRIL